MKKKNDTRGISRHYFFRTLALGAAVVPSAALRAQPAPPALTPDAGNLRTFIELARSDLRMQKAFIIAQNLPLTEPQAMEFWPLHREYAEALAKLQDERLAGIMQLVNDYASMTDPQAVVLANKFFDLEEKRTALKRKYFKKFSSVITAVKAARFFQIDNQLNVALDLQVAASLPLIK